MDPSSSRPWCPPIAPRSDATALRRLTTLFRARGFDVVHTHSAKAGALGRLAAHRAGVPLVAHTYHGFPFHEFQNPLRQAAYVAIERRLARITDEVLAIGTGVATEALRRGLARPDALHDRARGRGQPRRTHRRHPRAGPRAARPRPGRARGRHGRADRLPEGARAPHRRDGTRSPAATPCGLDRLRPRRPARPRSWFAPAGSPTASPWSRRALRRGPAAPRLRRVRDGQPLRGPALRGGRGDALRPSRRGDRGELGARPGRAGRERRAGAARPSGAARARDRRPARRPRARRAARGRADRHSPPRGTTRRGWPRCSTRCTPRTRPPARREARTA